MSKNYLTFDQVIAKTGIQPTKQIGTNSNGLPIVAFGSGHHFVSKDWLVGNDKFDQSLLSKYRDTEYVVDDDIAIGTDFVIATLSLSATATSQELRIVCSKYPAIDSLTVTWQLNNSTTGTTFTRSANTFTGKRSERLNVGDKTTVIIQRMDGYTYKGQTTATATVVSSAPSNPEEPTITLNINELLNNNTNPLK